MVVELACLRTGPAAFEIDTRNATIPKRMSVDWTFTDTAADERTFSDLAMRARTKA